jgi:GT2 family glycosyltransferase
LRRLLTTDPRRLAVDIVVVNGGAPDDRLTAICRSSGRPVTHIGPRSRTSDERRSVLRRRAVDRVPACGHSVTAAWSDEIRRAGADPDVVGGSFRFRLDSAAWQARLIERAVERRVRWLDLAYGDQALFVRRDVFDAMGGYREWPLMEDVDFVRRLRQLAGCITRRNRC